MKFNFRFGFTLIAFIFAMVSLSAQNLTVAESVNGSTTNGWVKWNTSGLDNATMHGTTTIDGTTYSVTASWSGGTRLHHCHLQALLDAGGNSTWVSNATSHLMPSGLTNKNRHGLYLQNSPYATTNTTITITVSPAAAIARFNVGDAENDAAKTTLYWNEDYTITGANMTDYHQGGYTNDSYGTPTATSNSLTIPTTYRDNDRYAEEYVYHGKGSTSTSSITWSFPGNNIGSDYEEFSGVALALQLMEPCAAGSSAPQYNPADNLDVPSCVFTIPCGSSTANLNSITASNQPSGTTMTWHTSATASSNNLVSNASAVGPGTYYVAFYDSANSCYSTSTSHLNVVAETNCCNAGSNAPALNSSSTFNSSTNVFTIPCGSTTVSLTSLSASNQPAGTALTWHTSSTASASNLVSNPQAVGAGTYYAAFYDSSNSCYSTSTTQVTAVAETNCCNAGSNAPVLNSSSTFHSATNTFIIPCGSTAVNLASLTSSNQPAGTTLTWHTSSTASASNLVSNPHSVGAGTYYAAFYDSSNSCYSSTTTQVTVVAETDCCNAGNIAPTVN